MRVPTASSCIAPSSATSAAATRLVDAVIASRAAIIWCQAVVASAVTCRSAAMRW